MAEDLREKVQRKGNEDGCLQTIQALELSRPWVRKAFSAAILRWRCLKRSRVSLTIQGGAAMNRGGTESNLRYLGQNLVEGFWHRLILICMARLHHNYCESNSRVVYS